MLTKKLTKHLQTFTGIVIVAMVVYHMYVTIFGIRQPLLHRGRHLAFAVIVLLLLEIIKYFQSGKGSLPNLIISVMGILLMVFFIAYFTREFSRFEGRWCYVNPVYPMDVVVGFILLGIVLYTAWLKLGYPLPVLAMVFLAYAFWGNYIPGYWGHQGFPTHQIIEHMYLIPEGIFSVPIAVSSRFIYLFILFGSVLQVVGIGDFFLDLANALVGRTRGGPAKVAVLGSAFFGSISGAPIANVMTTGTFTIPTMIKSGYSKIYSASVEAAASTGGTILPPLMGSVAFLMADVVGIPYIQVAKASAIPAVLYFVSVFAMVHFQALKQDLKGLEAAQVPKLSHAIRTGGHCFIPIVVIVYMLVVGYSPAYAATGGIAAALVASFFKKHTRINWAKLYEICNTGTTNAVPVIVACATAGIIVGVVSLTGLGSKVSGVILGTGGDILIVSLFFVMITALVLGMGVTISSTYIMTAVLAAPALISIGADRIATHLFILYFAGFATLTPPVALTAFAAASIAGTNMMRTGFVAWRVAMIGFIIPFIFVYNPELLMQGEPGAIIVAAGSALIGVLAFAAGLEGYLMTRANLLTRILLLGGGLAMIVPGLLTDVIGLSLIGIAVLLQITSVKKASLPKKLKA